MSTFFGDLEAFVGDDLYPYRWPLAFGLIVAAAAVSWLGFRLGWQRALRRHVRLSITVTAVALAIGAPLGYYTLSPLWTRTELVEASPLIAADAEGAAPGTDAALDQLGGSGFAPRVVSTGAFRGADEFHFGEGTAKIIETAPGRFTLRFEAFSVRNGPDLYVYLSRGAEGDTDDALNLGRLKATDGAFNYDIPAGTDIARFQSAIIWCKRFTVLFATAPLGPA